MWICVDKSISSQADVLCIGVGGVFVSLSRAVAPCWQFLIRNTCVYIYIIYNIHVCHGIDNLQRYLKDFGPGISDTGFGLTCEELMFNTQFRG